MRSRLIALAVPITLAWGCSFDTSGVGGDAGRQLPPPPDGGDGRADARPAADGGERDAGSSPCGSGEAFLPFEPTNFGPCVPAPDRSIEVSDGELWLLDTDEITIESDGVGEAPPDLAAVDVIDQPGGPQLLVVSVERLSIGGGATLYARGSRALALVATGDIVVEEGGLLSAGGFFRARGPGVDDEACADEGGRGEDGAEEEFDGEPGGTGGGGGGYGGAGGAGAHVQASDQESDPDADPPAGGAANDDDDNALSPLRGGCSGGDGFQVDSGEGGVGGGGGGGLQLVAADTIVVDGAVSVSGGGGGAGDAHSGGGGGGSGGALLLEAREIDVRSGALTANGGGGGQGMRRKNDTFCPGRDGENGSRDSDQPAQGGAGPGPCDTAGSGGDGGTSRSSTGEDGFTGDSEQEDGGGAAPAGGGGGGGGVGRIRIGTCDDLRDDGAVLSPEPITASLECEDG